MKENLIDQHKDDLRSLKQIHDQHWQDHLRTTTSTVEQLQTEIRSLKRLIDEKNTEVKFHFNFRIKFHSDDHCFLL